ncbi:MAG: recombinase zinc beta ribbon domain-containing protein [Myxococcota bacterium]
MTGYGHSRYLLSGLLHCGQCGARMTIMSGASAAYYRCSAQRKGGSCESVRSIREEQVRTGILGQLRRQLQTPDVVAYVRQRIIKRLGEQVPRCQAELDRHRQQLKETRARIKSLIDYLAEGESTHVKSALRDLEAQARAQKATIAALKRQAKQPLPRPDVGRLTAAVFELDRRLRDDVQQGREHLRRLFGNGLQLVMTEDGCEVHAPILGVLALPG